MTTKTVKGKKAPIKKTPPKKVIKKKEYLKVDRSIFLSGNNGFVNPQKMKVGIIFEVEHDNRQFSIREHKGKVETFASNKPNAKPILQEKSVHYIVYRTDELHPWTIDENQALALARFFGYKALDIEITHIHQPAIQFPVVYIAKATVREPQHLGGEDYSNIANASLANLREMMIHYAPEMAGKRAMVRTILRAMGILDCSFEGEFKGESIIVNQDTAGPPPENGEASTSVNKSTSNTTNGQGDILENTKKVRQIKSIRDLQLNKPRYGNFTEEHILVKYSKKKLEECSVEELEDIIQRMNKEGPKKKK